MASGLKYKRKTLGDLLIALAIHHENQSIAFEHILLRQNRLLTEKERKGLQLVYKYSRKTAWILRGIGNKMEVS